MNSDVFICLNTLNTLDVLIAMIFSDKAADKCLRMIGWLWSEKGEEISRCLYSN